MPFSTIRQSLLRYGLALLALFPAVASAQNTFAVSVVPGNASHPNPNHYSEVFAIDGIAGKELTLERGTTYTFNTTGVSDMHPFMISRELVSSTTYDEGVTGNMAHSGATLTFTPSSSAPDTLYYVCWRHSNMGWRIVLTGLKAAPDFTVTVATKDNTHPAFGMGWSEGYLVNGLQGREITVERGIPHRFQMSNVPVIHPFYITTSPEGIGADPYEDGVVGNGATGNSLLTFTPPANAPDTLYYNCMNHANMGWRILVTPPLSSGVKDARANAGILTTVAPNPVRGSAEFTLTPPGSGAVRVAPIGADGREAQLVYEGALSAGVPRAFRVETGAMPAGTYRLQVTGSTFSVGQNISVAR